MRRRWREDLEYEERGSEAGEEEGEGEEEKVAGRREEALSYSKKGE